MKLAKTGYTLLVMKKVKNLLCFKYISKNNPINVASTEKSVKSTRLTKKSVEINTV